MAEPVIDHIFIILTEICLLTFKDLTILRISLLSNLIEVSYKLKSELQVILPGSLLLFTKGVH